MKAGLSLLISAEIVISTEHRSHQTLEEWKCSVRQWKAPSWAVKLEPSCFGGRCWQSRARSKCLTWNWPWLHDSQVRVTAPRSRQTHTSWASSNCHQVATEPGPLVWTVLVTTGTKLINCSPTVCFCHSSSGFKHGCSSACESASSFSSSKGLTH